MDENDESLFFVTFWDCRTHVPMTSSVERTDLDFKISVALSGTNRLINLVTIFLTTINSFADKVKLPTWQHTCTKGRGIINVDSRMTGWYVNGTKVTTVCMVPWLNLITNNFNVNLKIPWISWRLQKIMHSKCLYIWATIWQNQQSECAPSEDSDQPGHPPSLIRVFAVHMKKAWVLSYPLSTQGRFWSDWADAQADLSLRWAHTHFVGFVMSSLEKDKFLIFIYFLFSFSHYRHVSYKQLQMFSRIIPTTGCSVWRHEQCLLIC